jgi:hypothetical protein
LIPHSYEKYLRTKRLKSEYRSTNFSGQKHNRRDYSHGLYALWNGYVLSLSYIRITKLRTCKISSWHLCALWRHPRCPFNMHPILLILNCRHRFMMERNLRLCGLLKCRRNQN